MAQILGIRCDEAKSENSRPKLASLGISEQKERQKCFLKILELKVGMFRLQMAGACHSALLGTLTKSLLKVVVWLAICVGPYSLISVVIIQVD